MWRTWQQGRKREKKEGPRGQMNEFSATFSIWAAKGRVQVYNLRQTETSVPDLPIPFPCFFNLVDPRGRRGTFPVISSPPNRKFCSGGVTLLFVFPRFLIPSQAKSNPPSPCCSRSLGARHKNPVPLPEKVWKSGEKIWLLFSTKKGFRATSSANSWSPKVSIL